MTESYWLELALMGDRVVPGVRVSIADGRFSEVAPGGSQVGATVIAGLTMPGLANCHSHAFHRALRGRVQGEAANDGRGSVGSFWTWRDRMYALAARLTPDTYYRLARATFAEMVASGFTTVGEFHYLHHDPAGRPYTDPNTMGQTVIRAARDVGIRITVLDTCYLSSGADASREPRGVTGTQRRFTDGDAAAWAERVDALAAAARAEADPGVRVGAAAHSVRAVPADQLPAIARWATERQAPVHVHVSEQIAENEQCLAAYERTPSQLLDDAGLLGSRTSVVHGTHLTDADIRLLGQRSVSVCVCPTTEQDLGDGIGPTVALRDAGATITIGTDSHAVIDGFTELRQIEVDERLARRTRGHWSAIELLRAGTVEGHASLGFGDAGEMAIGARADLVTLDHRSVRTAGAGDGPEMVVFAAGAPDVRQVIIDGDIVFTAADLPALGSEMYDAVARAWTENGS